MEQDWMRIDVSNWRVRVAGILLALATAWYVPWLLTHANRQNLWFSIPFVLATLLTSVMTLVTVHNHWYYLRPDGHAVLRGQEPVVAIIVPTYGEPPSMVYDTVASVLAQDYPADKMWVVVSDDARRPQMRAVVDRLAAEHPDSSVKYHVPPRRGEPERRGDAKAGNLNSALDVVRTLPLMVPFVETRDADDLVVDRSFLRLVVGQLLSDPRAAFVQTIKEAVVSPGDPFGNLEPLFYRKAMLAKHADNAVFPCGSGVVWRSVALVEIGGFPSWNLVEDLQSGVEALRRGWHGIYLPIIGAMGQTAPEDIPNAIKQRGTWAIDTMRMSFWGNRRGLNLQQHLQFSELGLFYLLSFAILVFAATPVFTLALGTMPIAASQTDYFMHLGPYVATIELLLLSLAHGLPYRMLWRARQTWVGMAPVYAQATLIALFYGPRRKPTYRVTRKENVYAWYWREVLPQIVLVLALVAASLYHILTRAGQASIDIGSLLWAGYFSLVLSRVVRNSWFGIHRKTTSSR